MNGDSVTLTLSKQQALVLFEWASNLDSTKHEIFQHPAEEKVIWDITAQLEKALVEPFAPNYRVLLDNARIYIDQNH